MATKKSKPKKLTMTQVQISELNDRITTVLGCIDGNRTNIEQKLSIVYKDVKRYGHKIRALEEAICPRVAARLTALERASVKDGWVGSVDGRSNFNLREFVKHVQEANTRLAALEKALNEEQMRRIKPAQPLDRAQPLDTLKALTNVDEAAAAVLAHTGNNEHVHYGRVMSNIYK